MSERDQTALTMMVERAADCHGRHVSDVLRSINQSQRIPMPVLRDMAEAIIRAAASDEIEAAQSREATYEQR